MYTLFHLKNSRSQRVIWALELLNICYTLVIVEDAKQSVPHTHALAKYPVLQFSSGELLGETSAIIDYLFQKHCHNRDSENLSTSQDYLFFMADNTYMPLLMLKQVFQQLVHQSPFFAKPFMWLIKKSFSKMYLNQQLHQCLTLIEHTLSGSRYLSGITVGKADVMFVQLLIWTDYLGLINDQLPHVQHYLQTKSTA